MTPEQRVKIAEKALGLYILDVTKHDNPLPNTNFFSNAVQQALMDAEDFPRVEAAWAEAMTEEQLKRVTLFRIMGLLLEGVQQMSPKDLENVLDSVKGALPTNFMLSRPDLWNGTPE